MAPATTDLTTSSDVEVAAMAGAEEKEEEIRSGREAGQGPRRLSSSATRRSSSDGIVTPAVEDGVDERRCTQAFVNDG